VIAAVFVHSGAPVQVMATGQDALACDLEVEPAAG
jgi:hypothetical protein